MLKKIIAWTLALAVTSVSAAQYETDLIFGVNDHFSMVSGASFMDTANILYRKLDDHFIPSSKGNCSFAAGAGRFLKWTFLDSPVNLTLVVVNHEVFGHGARGREFGGSPSYDINVFSGTTYFTNGFYNGLNGRQRALVDTGGVEASSNLAKFIALKSLRNQQRMDARAAGLYFWSATDMMYYIASTKDMDPNDFSHDINAYINQINNNHGRVVLTDSDLREKNLVNFLDPFLYFSIINQAQYIASGDTHYQIPMLEINGFGYLPGMHLNLSPYGPEYQFNNYIRDCRGDIHFAYVRYGKTGDHDYYGLGAEISNVYNYQKFRLSVAVDGWNQPRTVANYMSGSELGGRLSLRGEYPLTNTISFTPEVAVKSEGYLPAEPLKGGPIFRLGLRAMI